MDRGGVRGVAGRRPRAAVALAVAGALLATGCGASDEELSVKEFQTRADGVCERYNRALAGVGDASTVEEIPKVLDATRPLLQRMVADLQDIEPPKRFATDYAGVIDRARGALDTLDKLRTAAGEGDIQQITRVAAAAQRADRTAARQATNAGLPRCAKS